MTFNQGTSHKIDSLSPKCSTPWYLLEKKTAPVDIYFFFFISVWLEFFNIIIIIILVLFSFLLLFFLFVCFGVHFKFFLCIINKRKTSHKM